MLIQQVVKDIRQSTDPIFATAGYANGDVNYDGATNATDAKLIAQYAIGESSLPSEPAQTQKFFYYHADHLGSGNVITDQYGELVQHVEYTPFGEIRYEQDLGQSVNYLYTGQEYDREVGLYYYQSRYYDANLGRFIQPDTIVPDPSDSQAFNRFIYAGNDPVNFKDPTGHVKDRDFTKDEENETIRQEFEDKYGFRPPRFSRRNQRQDLDELKRYVRWYESGDVDEIMANRIDANGWSGAEDYFASLAYFSDPANSINPYWFYDERGRPGYGKGPYEIDFVRGTNSETAYFDEYNDNEQAAGEEYLEGNPNRNPDGVADGWLDGPNTGNQSPGGSAGETSNRTPEKRGSAQRQPISTAQSTTTVTPEKYIAPHHEHLSERVVFLGTQELGGGHWQSASNWNILDMSVQAGNSVFYDVSTNWAGIQRSGQKLPSLAVTISGGYPLVEGGGALMYLGTQFVTWTYPYATNALSRFSKP